MQTKLSVLIQFVVKSCFIENCENMRFNVYYIYILWKFTVLVYLHKNKCEN